MARWEFKLPDIGEGITEGEIVSWLVAAGEVVKEDQPIVEVMTDKATVTITAPKAGKVVETRGKVGEIVAVHAVLLVFELDGEGPGAPSSGRAANGAGGAAGDRDGPAATAVGDLKESLPGLPAHPSASPSAAPAAAFFSEKPLATPATRKLARDLGVDLRRVPPSGPQGRVTKGDVESFVRPQGTGGARPGKAGATAPSSARPAGEAPTSALARGGAAGAAAEERVPLAGLRRRIAQKMAVSTHTAAHFTFVEECDAGALKALRARLVGPAAAAGVRLTYLPFIVKAVVAALKRHPALNASLDEARSEIVFRKYFHIGVATATEAGLVVPVVKDADRKSVLEVARDIERLAAQARASELRLEDVQGSTFTVTSLGAQSGLLATPIINYPEVAILGVHRIKEKPVVRNGQVVVGDVMLLSLSFDHRVVDGHVGAAFAYELIGFLEAPDRLLLEMA
ncbi:MAG: 2-oxo acid dehydrogenase subunit E2 [Myxococcales bacterium]|nr:2-oxo acid dehydrogenase subunit E2 [Myxococcales bacterium]